MAEHPGRAARQAARRQAARRRQLVTMLQISEATCRYAAGQLGDGIGPAEATETARFVAAELAVVAEALRRATRPGPSELPLVIARLTRLGLPRRRVAELAGVSERTVARYLARSRSPAGG